MLADEELSSSKSLDLMMSTHYEMVHNKDYSNTQWFYNMQDNELWITVPVTDNGAYISISNIQNQLIKYAN
jgi:hypothetical protein